MMSNLERLVYMANQIARNFAAMRQGDAPAAVADHIAKFWDPRMRAQIFAIADEPGNALGHVAAEAVALLKTKGPPPPQTRATEFASVDGTGHDDAG